MSHFVFVESNTTGTGGIALARLLERGDRVTFLSGAPDRYDFLRGATGPLRVHTVDTNEVAAVIAEVDRLRQHEPVDAMLTFSDFYVVTVAETAARCGLRALDPRAARICRNKAVARRALRAVGEPVPEFRVVRTLDHARAVARACRYPCVVKPTADSSSFGVKLARDARELEAHCAWLLDQTTNVRGQPVEREALIESELQGPEFSVETLTERPAVTHVLGVTQKHVSAPPFFVEVGHDFPASIDDTVHHALVAAALGALAAVGFDFGPAHTEIRLTRSGPVVVEVNARLAGGMIPQLIEYATGIRVFEALFDLLLGRPLDLKPSRDERASIRFLIAPSTGRLTGVSGVDEARRAPSIRDVHVARSCGSPIRTAESAYDRLGWVIGSGRGDRITADVESARRLIALEIDPASELAATP